MTLVRIRDVECVCFETPLTHRYGSRLASRIDPYHGGVEVALDPFEGNGAELEEKFLHPDVLVIPRPEL